MAVGLVYLMLVRVLSWLALLARSDAAKDADSGAVGGGNVGGVPRCWRIGRGGQGGCRFSRGVATEEYDVIEYDVVKDDVFATDERVTLRFAPFWVLAAFAGRQRGFDQSEFEAFSRVIEEASERARGRLGGRVLQRVAMDLDRIAAAFGNDRRSVATGLYEVRGLIERLPPDEALAFRETLVCGVGEGIAKARGRYGRIISEEDGRTLELVEALLS